MMSDFEFNYWSVPSRGQIVRAGLAYADKTWTEGGDAAIAKMIGRSPKDMPIPFMRPPMLIDTKVNVDTSKWFFLSM